MSNVVRLVSLLLMAGVPDYGSEHAGLDPEATLKHLMEGNARFAQGAAAHPHANRERRDELAKGQHPPAVVLTCADSRVPPELLFDQGLGDLFVLRVAGNVTDDFITASVEYALEHLGSRLVMVLGHQRCGAVDAAVKGGEAHGHVVALVHALQPAVEDARGVAGDPVENAVRANVRRVVNSLKTSAPVISKLVESGQVKGVGARYGLDSGAVELLK